MPAITPAVWTRFVERHQRGFYTSYSFLVRIVERMRSRELLSPPLRPPVTPSPPFCCQFKPDSAVGQEPDLDRPHHLKTSEKTMFVFVNRFHLTGRTKWSKKRPLARGDRAGVEPHLVESGWRPSRQHAARGCRPPSQLSHLQPP